MKRLILVVAVAAVLLFIVGRGLWIAHHRAVNAAFLRGTLEGEMTGIAWSAKSLELLDSGDVESLREGFEFMLMMSASHARDTLETGVRPEMIASPDLRGLERAVDYASTHELKGDPLRSLRYIQRVYQSLWKAPKDDEADT